MFRANTVVFFFLLLACVEEKESLKTHNLNDASIVASSNEEALSLMQKHLDAVSNRNLEVLAETLTPDGTMQLILPAIEIIDGNEAFINYHKEWFAFPDWTFETKILKSEMGLQMASVIVEAIYSEPERNDKPYYNKMIVSYVLKKIDGIWYVMKDHASSIEKSTD